MIYFTLVIFIDFANVKIPNFFCCRLFAVLHFGESFTVSVLLGLFQSVKAEKKIYHLGSNFNTSRYQQRHKTG